MNILAGFNKSIPRFITGAAFLGMLAFGGVALAQKEAADSTDENVKVNAATKTVINGALKYLVSKQHLDGSWYLKEGLAGHPVAMTGYTLIAFMSSGNLPDEGPYKKNVAAGMQFLLDSIQPDGLFRGVSRGQYMYNHGIATVALAELYGETHSSTIRPKLERVIKVILDAQNPAGGWRYTPRPTDADISVTVLQAVALRAAQEAGLAVPQGAIDKAVEYVRSCHDEATNGFCYQPGKGAGFARTSGAIYALQVLGKYDDPKVKAGSAYLFANHRKGAGEQWAYGNYYAAPAQYMIGGETWRNWYSQTSKMLLEAAVREGDMVYWEDAANGAIFSTAVYVTILAIPYHFLPLYQR